ncbi:MAG: hypothetical protein WKF30_00590 [Pyrinomonadaceae bacterium]
MKAEDERIKLKVFWPYFHPSSFQGRYLLQQRPEVNRAVISEGVF